MSLPRIIKYPLFLLALLIALVVLAGVAITVLVDPNQFKPVLQQQVEQATSLDLQINGDLGWQFFPKLAISIGETELHTQKAYAGETRFAKLGAFDVGIGWGGLLRGALLADRLQIDGLALRLVTDANGHSNWKDVEAAAPAAKSTEPAPAADSSHSLAFELAVLQLDNIVVDMVDLSLASKQHFGIDSLQASNVNIEGRPFPLRTVLSLASSDTVQGRALDLRLQSMVTIDNAREIYALKEIDGQFDKSRFNGELNVGLGKQTVFSGDIAIDKLNLDEYMDEPAATTSTAEASSGDEALPFDSLKTLNTKLGMHIGQLIAQGAVLDDVRLNAAIKNGVVNVAQLRANVFSGVVDMTLRLDTSRVPATLNVQPKLENVAVAEVLANRSIAVNLSGNTTIKSNLTMRGNSTNAWLASLGGYTEFAFNEGRYGDDNIERRVCQAIALARQQTLNESWAGDTKFQSVDARIDWSNGVGNISSFKAGLDNLQLGGSGTLSLPAKNFDLRVSANLTGDISGKDPACAINEKYRNVSWPLRCRGSAEDSSCGVDNSALEKIISGALKDRAKQEVLEKVDEKVGKKIEEKLGKGVSDALKGLFK